MSIRALFGASGLTPLCVDKVICCLYFISIAGTIYRTAVAVVRYVDVFTYAVKQVKFRNFKQFCFFFSVCVNRNEKRSMFHMHVDVKIT